MQKAFSQPFESFILIFSIYPLLKLKKEKKDEEKPGQAMKITFLALIMLH